MIKIDDKSRCCGCKGCESSCPTHCIEMEEDSEGFWYPSVNITSCTNCGICEAVCPVLHSDENSECEIISAYSVVTNDNEAKAKSSSGGFFFELSKKFLKEQGVVYGCAMSKDCLKAEHIRIDSEKQICLLQGSKYLQSDASGVFVRVKQDLRDGKKVLFSGTPCLVAGLKRALCGVNTEKLMMIDFICHGVPSPKVWRQYAAILESKNNDHLCFVSFRDKTAGWHKYSLRCSFENGNEYINDVTRDLYLRGFVMNDFLRPSCYDCKFKGNSYASDITMADFWGVEDVFPGSADNKGISLVLVHTELGKRLVEEISGNIKSQNIDAEKGLKQNPSYYKSVQRRSVRDAFFKSFEKNPQKAFEKFGGLNFKTKIVRKKYACIDKIRSVTKKASKSGGKNNVSISG